MVISVYTNKVLYCHTELDLIVILFESSSSHHLNLSYEQTLVKRQMLKATALIKSDGTVRAHDAKNHLKVRNP